MSPRKMQTPDLVRLTIAVGAACALLCVPIAYAGIADEAIDTAARMERLSIIGFLSFAVVVSQTGFFWLLRVLVLRDATERKEATEQRKELSKVIETAAAAMMACHDARQARGG
jgi:hypothetical protein